jgi:hypothetical protein
MSTAAYRLPERRAGALALTVLVHAALLLAWHTAQHPLVADGGARPREFQWVWLPAPVPASTPAPAPQRTATPPLPAASRQARNASASTQAAPETQMIAVPATKADPAPAAPPAPAPAPAPPSTLQRALRDAGAVDRALRKENNPYIVAPLDSPQLRMRRGLEAAHDAAPTKWYEAPRIDELVNNTGDGARRTRVRSGGGTYCITEVSPASSIDTIEKGGKTRITSCPAHETPAGKQEWRTARD